MGPTVDPPLESKVEPLAVGTVLKRYMPGHPNWEGHFELVPELTWDDMPEFAWTDLFAQVAAGLNDPDWAGWSKKTRNKFKRERIATAAKELEEYDRLRDERLEEARKAVEEYEVRNDIPKGSILKSVYASETDSGWLTPWAIALPDAQSPGVASAASDGLGSLYSC